MSKTACQPETIFSSSTCDLQFCPDCQLIHLTLGAITIRMTEEHFSLFARDVNHGAVTVQNKTDAIPATKLLM